MKYDDLQAMSKFNDIIELIFQRKTIELRSGAGNYEKLSQVEERFHEFRFLNKALKIANFDILGKRVLDVGCGMGIVSILMTCLGAGRVDAIDYIETDIDILISLLSYLDAKIPVFPAKQDATDMEFPSDSFDQILAIESISHFHDPEKFFTEAFRVLRKNGSLLMVDTNNGVNPWRVYQNHQLWDAYENGPVGIKLQGKTIINTYHQKRGQIIKEMFPEFSQKEIENLSTRTSGMWREEIIKVCYAYKTIGTLPSSFYHHGVCPLDPVRRGYPEFLFDPRKLKKSLTDMGFSVKYRPYFGGSNNAVLDIVDRVLSRVPFSIRFAPSFLLWAEKQ